MRSRKFALGLGFFFSVLASSGAAFAQSPAGATSSASPSSYPSCAGRTIAQSESDAAHTIYLAGRVQYDDSNWDAAIAQFREAYRRDCTKHELLVIISRAYESKGEKREALNALQTYLDRVPANNPDVPAMRTRMENIRRQIALDEEANKQRDEEARKARERDEQLKKQSTTEPPPVQTVKEHTVYPWIVVGAGVVAAAVGVVVIATAPSLPENCDASSGTCRPIAGESADAFANRKSDAGKSQDQPTYGIITAAAGGALIAGGLIWHFLEHTGPSEAGRVGLVSMKPKVSPQVGQGYAGLSLGGAF